MSLAWQGANWHSRVGHAGSRHNAGLSCVQVWNASRRLPSPVSACNSWTAHTKTTQHRRSLTGGAPCAREPACRLRLGARGRARQRAHPRPGRAGAAPPPRSAPGLSACPWQPAVPRVGVCALGSRLGCSILKTACVHGQAQHHASRQAKHLSAATCTLWCTYIPWKHDPTCFLGCSPIFHVSYALSLTTHVAWLQATHPILYLHRPLLAVPESGDRSHGERLQCFCTSSPSHGPLISCCTSRAATVGTCSKASRSRSAPMSAGSGRSHAGAPARSALPCAKPCAAHPAGPSPQLVLHAPGPMHAQGRAAWSAAGMPTLPIARAGSLPSWQLHRAAAGPGGGRRQASSSRSTAARCAALSGSSRKATAQNVPGTCCAAASRAARPRLECMCGARKDRTAHNPPVQAILLSCRAWCYRCALNCRCSCHESMGQTCIDNARYSPVQSRCAAPSHPAMACTISGCTGPQGSKRHMDAQGSQCQRLQPTVFARLAHSTASRQLGAATGGMSAASSTRPATVPSKSPAASETLHSTSMHASTLSA